MRTPQTIKIKKEDENFDTNHTSITPVRVQRFNLNDF